MDIEIRLTEKQEQALARQAARDARSDEEQLKLIADRRGESKREVDRLQKRIADAKNRAKNNEKKDKSDDGSDRNAR